MALDPLQRDVWDMSFDPVEGHEQGGFRPALVLSQTSFNTSGVDLVIVAAMTSHVRGWGSEVPIQPPEGGLTLPSVVLAHQIRTVAHARLVRRRGHVRMSTLDAVLAVTNTILSRRPPSKAVVRSTSR